MSTQGASYKTPTTAKAANKSYVDRSGFHNRVVKNLPSEMGRVEDKRVREQGPLDARDPRYIDKAKKRFDPNNPNTRSFPEYQKMVNKNLGEKDAFYRGFARKDRFTTPREIAEKSSMMQAEGNAWKQGIMNQVQRDRRQANTGVITRNQPNIGKEYGLAKAQASAALPDVKLGVRPVPRLSGIGNLPSRYKPERDALRTSPGKVDIGFRKGGLVKKKKR